MLARLTQVYKKRSSQSLVAELGQSPTGEVDISHHYIEKHRTADHDRSLELTDFVSAAEMKARVYLLIAARSAGQS